MSRQNYVYPILVIIVLSGLINKFFVLNLHQVPPSCDSANWLTMVDIMDGNDVVGYGLSYPPIFMILLYFLTKIMSPLLALKVSGILVSSIIGIPFFFLARRISDDFSALFATLLFTFSGAYSEVFAWGGYPQLLGIFFMLISLCFFTKVINTGAKKDIIIFAIFTSLTIGTHALSAFYLLLTFLTYIPFMLIIKRSELTLISKRIVSALSLSAVLSLPYASIYSNLYWNLGTSTGLNTSLPDLFGSLSLVFKDNPYLWLIMTAVGFITTFWYYRHDIIRAIIFPLMALPLILFIFFSEIRFLYMLVIPAVLSFSVFLSVVHMKLRKRGIPVKVIFIALLLLLGVFAINSSQTRLAFSMSYYQYIYDDELEGLNWLKDNTLPSDIVATTGSEKSTFGASYGWWIQGYSERRSLMAGDLKWFILKYEKHQGSIANRIFQQNTPETLAYQLLKENGVTYLFMNKMKPYDYQKFLANQHFKVVFENQRIMIIAVI